MSHSESDYEPESSTASEAIDSDDLTESSEGVIYIKHPTTVIDLSNASETSLSEEMKPKTSSNKTIIDLTASNPKRKERDRSGVMSDLSLNPYPPLSYGKSSDVEYVRSLIANGQSITLGKFDMKSVLYAFVVRLTTVRHLDVIVKFGWTNNLLDRITSLEQEYKSKFYLLAVKQVKNESKEKKFHKLLKRRFPDNIEPLTIGNKKKVELYKFHPYMLDEFEAVKSVENTVDILEQRLAKLCLLLENKTK